MLQLVVDGIHRGTTAAGIQKLLAKNVLLERHVSSHQYVQDHANAPKVRRRRIVSLQGLWSQVSQGTNHVFGTRRFGFVLQASIEINQLHSLLTGRCLRRVGLIRSVVKHDVFWLNVPVDQTPGVDMIDRFQDLTHDALALALRHICLGLKKVKQFTATTTGHDNVVVLLILDDFLQSQDIVVALQIQHSRQERLPHSLAAYCKIPCSHLDNHILATRLEDCFPDLSLASDIVQALLQIVFILQRLIRLQNPDGSIACHVQLWGLLNF
mmetsp:Transcript_115815/g.162782  ORF Transcript_115815/g.162782 Transcript_115815/m.162782 type:complete len:268 (-) Transcript_115815:47-850(-)